MWHIALTNETDQRLSADSGGVDNNRYSKLGDLHEVERGRWFLCHNWHTLPGTWDVLLGHDSHHGCHRHYVRKTSLQIAYEPLDILDSEWEHL